MSVYKIFSFYEKRLCLSGNLPSRKFALQNANPKKILFYSTNINIERKQNRYLQFFTSKWSLIIGLGTAVSTYIFLTNRSHGENLKEGPINDIMVDCYCHLPLRITSRIWGWIAEMKLPISIRPKVYGYYAKTFNANLDEIDQDITSFPSLVDFFVRPLKSDARPISGTTDIVSPSDGVVVNFGPVTSCNAVQVKGVTYNLRHFLGDIDWPGFDRDSCQDYISSLLKNPDNRLYQLTVYLAPGDYHRFHSPTDWKINFRRHFQGKLLSVNPKIASWLPNLFALNERVVYIGEWASGFLAYVAIGATNVGSIRVFPDKDLVTNAMKWPANKLSEDTDMGGIEVKKGELFGEFRMGSTIVLLFEAPRDFELFCVETGHSVKVGQPLARDFVKKEQQKRISCLPNWF